MSKMDPSATQDILIHLGWQKPASIFLPGKEGILSDNFKFQSLQKLILRDTFWDLTLGDNQLL